VALDVFWAKAALADLCNYRLIYQVEERSVHVIGFIHGSRDLWALWKKGPSRKQ
jgi:hypothetical protein